MPVCDGCGKIGVKLYYSEQMFPSIEGIEPDTKGYCKKCIENIPLNDGYIAEFNEQNSTYIYRIS